jgi:hypothetical protein
MHKEEEKACHFECLNDKAGVVLESGISFLNMNAGGNYSVDNDRAKL